MSTTVNAAVWHVYPFWEIPRPEGCTEGPYVATNKPLTYLDKDYNTQYVWPMRVQPSRERAAKDLLDAGWALDDVLEVLRRADRNGVSYEWNQNDDPDFGNT